ncbi:hypothetical protein ACFRMQ_15445 [Kitasatospora sp. NPDC056783]|uniref:hypothetical protein n=1 Tax=Kitasatospora sp. NPDC056783 TaxID=3345943 RepID=UPI0036B24AA9
MHGDLETDHDVLVTLARFTLATAEQLHQLHGGQADLEQPQKRMARLHAEGLAEFVTLPQAGRTRASHLTAAGAAVSATFPEARHPGHPGHPAATVRDSRTPLRHSSRGGCFGMPSSRRRSPWRLRQSLSASDAVMGRSLRCAV